MITLLKLEINLTNNNTELLQRTYKRSFLLLLLYLNAIASSLAAPKLRILSTMEQPAGYASNLFVDGELSIRFPGL